MSANPKLTALAREYAAARRVTDGLRMQGREVPAHIVGLVQRGEKLFQDAQRSAPALAAALHEEFLTQDHALNMEQMRHAEETDRFHRIEDNTLQENLVKRVNHGAGVADTLKMAEGRPIEYVKTVGRDAHGRKVLHKATRLPSDSERRASLLVIAAAGGALGKELEDQHNGNWVKKYIAANEITPRDPTAKKPDQRHIDVARAIEKCDAEAREAAAVDAYDAANRDEREYEPPNTGDTRADRLQVLRDASTHIPDDEA